MAAPRSRAAADIFYGRSSARPSRPRGTGAHLRSSTFRLLSRTRRFDPRRAPAADIVPRTRTVSRLYTRLHRIYMKKESPPFRPAAASPDTTRALPAPVKLFDGAPCSHSLSLLLFFLLHFLLLSTSPRRGCLQCKHGSSLSPGEPIFQKLRRCGPALCSSRVVFERRCRREGAR